MSAPIMPDVFCRCCGAQRIQQRWDEREGYRCANCGATNYEPLMGADGLPREEHISVRRGVYDHELEGVVEHKTNLP